MPKENSTIRTGLLKSDQPNDEGNSNYSIGMDTLSNIILMPTQIDFETIKTGRELFSHVKIVDIPNEQPQPK